MSLTKVIQDAGLTQVEMATLLYRLWTGSRKARIEGASPDTYRELWQVYLDVEVASYFAA